MVATPCYGGMVHAAYAKSIAGLINYAHQKRAYGVDLLMIMNESLIHRARNECLLRFSKSDCTHMLFIDSDITFPADAVEKLLSYRLPLVGGLYPIKTFAENKFAGEIDLSVRLAPHIVRAKYLPTGFMMIRKDVAVRMQRSFPDLRYTIDGGELKGERNWDLFRCDVVHDDPLVPGGRLLSEDWAFTRRALKIGIEAWADLSIELEHTGSHTFKAGLPQEVFAPERAAA